MAGEHDDPRSTVELITPSGSGDLADRPSKATGNRGGRALAMIITIVIGYIFVQLVNTDVAVAPDQEAAPSTDPGPAESEEVCVLECHHDTGGHNPQSWERGERWDLQAAWAFQAEPGADTLRHLFEAMGGIDGITVATAEGSFDMVTFHPMNPDLLTASRRSSYGPAQNQDQNQAWTVGQDGTVTASLLAPDVAHDFAHYNDRGGVSIWSHADVGELNGSSTGATGVTGDDFVPRVVALGPDRPAQSRRSDPLHPSRFVIEADTLFALTGDPDYYSTQRQFESLIADRGDGQIVLDDGAPWSWIDSPLPGFAVAYPADDQGETAVWAADTLERLDDHFLSGRAYRRLAVSADETTMVGVTAEGDLEVVDIGSDQVTGRFGHVDPNGIAQPISLNHNGTIAVTIDHDGTVSMWWVGDTDPIMVIDADAGPPRLLSEYRAPRVSSAVASGTERVAVRTRARPGQATAWAIIDTNPIRWIDRACSQAPRTLTYHMELGLKMNPPACA